LFTVAISALPAHGGHPGAWIEYIWISPIILFAGWLAWSAWRDRRRGAEYPPDAEGG
jgi:hypothetical protein